MNYLELEKLIKNELNKIIKSSSTSNDLLFELDGLAGTIRKKVSGKKLENKKLSF